MTDAVADMPVSSSPAPATVLDQRCPLCGATCRPWFETRGRHLGRCTACGLIGVAEGLAVNADGVSIYEADDRLFTADGNAGYYLDETNDANSRRKLQWVAEDLPAGARLLDAGCNYGHFLKAAQGSYEASGFDVSAAAVAWGREHFAVGSFVASVYDIPRPEASFDAVTCWDVVEHVPDPLAALSNLRRLLRPGGRLFLSTPDAGSLVARLLGRRWHYLDPVQHINVFSRRNLEQALRATGFDLVRVASLGHSYRLRYVFDRLCYLHPRGVLGATLVTARWMLRPALGLSVYLNPADVLIATAVRKD